MRSYSNRAVALIDGMNLYNHARNAFGDRDGRYDPVKLAQAVAASQDCELVQTRFYVGVPRSTRHPRLSEYWQTRLHSMEEQGVVVFRGTVNYYGEHGQEKGVDVRIALDSIQLILQRICDTLIIFSTDQDFQQIKPTATEVAGMMGGQIRIKSAFPQAVHFNVRGIDGTDWVPFDRDTYDACIDPRDFWPTRYY